MSTESAANAPKLSAKAVKPAVNQSALHLRKDIRSLVQLLLAMIVAVTALTLALPSSQAAQAAIVKPTLQSA